MAGSFGYKHDYYELSMAVGADLFAQAHKSEEGGSRVWWLVEFPVKSNSNREWAAWRFIRLRCWKVPSIGDY